LGQLGGKEKVRRAGEGGEKGTHGREEENPNWVPAYIGIGKKRKEVRRNWRAALNSTGKEFAKPRKKGKRLKGEEGKASRQKNNESARRKNQGVWRRKFEERNRLGVGVAKGGVSGKVLFNDNVGGTELRGSNAINWGREIKKKDAKGRGQRSS